MVVVLQQVEHAIFRREDDNLFRVAKAGSGECFVHTYFIDGDYCVPEQAVNTKRIFSILAQLIALAMMVTGGVWLLVLRQRSAGLPAPAKS